MPAILDQFGRTARIKASSQYTPGGYQAAGYSTARGRIWANARDSRHDITPFTRNEIDRKARYLDKNVGMPRGVRKDFIKYVVGPGIMPFSNTGDAALDAQYDEWFMEWAKICDLSGRLNLWDFQRAAVSNQFLSGDFFRVLTEKPGGYPQLKLIRAHNCRNSGDERDGSSWHDGVHLNKHDAASHYKFVQRDGSYRTLRASQVVHSMICEHGDEVRQVSALSAAILHIQDNMELLALEKSNVKDNQMASRVIKKDYPGMEDEHDDGDALGDNVASGSGTAPPIPLQALFGPEVVRLNEGESLQSFKSERPNATFTGFLNHLGRDINAATGWRYEFSWSPESINSSNMRQILDSCKRTAQLWQAEEVKATHRIRNFAIARAIEMGELPHTKNWWRAEYLPGSPDPTIDKGRDGKLDVLLVKNRMMTLKNYHGGSGKHWKLQLDQLKIEQEAMEERGISFADDHAPESDNTSADIKAPKDGDSSDGRVLDAEALKTIKGAYDAYGVGVRAGTITPQEDDEAHFRKMLNLPPAAKAVKAAWKTDGGARRPVTLKAQDDFENDGDAPKDPDAEDEV